MVVIRLSRAGTKKRPFYKIVAADSRSPRDGKFIEKLGFYNPIARGQEVALRLDSECYENWLAKGAQTTARVASLYKLHQKNGGQDLPARFEKTSKAPVGDEVVQVLVKPVKQLSEDEDDHSQETPPTTAEVDE